MKTTFLLRGGKLGISIIRHSLSTPRMNSVWLPRITSMIRRPHGPLALGDLLGPTNVLEVLFNMQTVYGDPRYRPSPWLRRRGAIGLSLKHIEA